MIQTRTKRGRSMHNIGIKKTDPCIWRGDPIDWDAEGDAWHVRWCEQHGGFPKAVVGAGGTSWVDPDGEQWEAASVPDLLQYVDEIVSVIGREKTRTLILQVMGALG